MDDGQSTNSGARRSLSSESSERASPRPQARSKRRSRSASGLSSNNSRSAAKDSLISARTRCASALSAICAVARSMILKRAWRAAATSAGVSFSMPRPIRRWA